MAVDGPVTVGEVTAPVSVNGSDGDPVMVGTSDGELLNVAGEVKVDSVGGRINVQLRNAAKSVLPLP